MAAVGLGLPAETFKDAGRYGYVPRDLGSTSYPVLSP